MALCHRSALAFFVVACQCAGVFSSAAAAPRSVTEVRFRTESDRTRIVLDLSGESRYTVKTATGPFRIVVDLPNCRFAAGVRNIDVRDGLIDRIRVNRLKSGAQVVLDLPRRAEFSHFPLKAGSGKPHRVVIDVARPEAGGARNAADEPARGGNPPGETGGGAVPGAKPVVAPRAAGGGRVVIIDPGHGGKHTGTISRSGIQEKTLTLKLAKMLGAEIEKRPGYTAVLVRESDRHFDEDRARDLVKRIEFAREREGDVYVSLHFNGNDNKKVNGLELYFLSLEASDENAGAVAERENLLVMTGADSGGFNDDLKSILFDVSLANAIQQSSALAEEAASVLRVNPPIPFRKVKQAPFLVLRDSRCPRSSSREGTSRIGKRRRSSRRRATCAGLRNPSRKGSSRSSKNTPVNPARRPGNRRGRVVRFRNLYRAVTENIGIKIVSILFASLLWLYVTAQIGERQTFKVPLDLVNIPESLTVASGSPKTVSITIRGARSELMKLRFLSRIKGTVDLGGAREGRVVVPLSAAILNLPAGFPAGDASIESPKSLTLDFERIVSAYVPVTPVFRGSVPQGMILVGQPSVSPPLVLVRGTAAAMSGVAAVETEPIDLRNKRSGFSQEAALRAGERLEAIPRSVRVEIGIAKRAVRTMPGIPPTLLQEEDGFLIEYSPSSASLTVEGPEELVNRLVNDDLSIVLSIPPGLRGTGWILPEVIVPQGIDTFTIDVDSFEVKVLPKR